MIKIQSAFNIICRFFSYGLYTMAINVFTWRITTKRVHLFSSLAQFSLIASFCIFLQKIRRASRNFFNFIYIYIYIFEIRNSEIYLPEVSVSSTMDFIQYFVCKYSFSEISMIKILILDQSKPISLYLKIKNSKIQNLWIVCLLYIKMEIRQVCNPF